MDRRLKSVAVHFALLDRLIRIGNKIAAGECVDGIPSGAKFVSSYVDFASQTGYLVYWDESFDVVPGGVSVPVAHVEYRELREKG